MGWESRKRGGRYYYRSQRVGDRVRKVYAGGGTIGELAAEADRIKRERREVEALLVKEEKERLEALASPILELSEAAEILAQAHLVASGLRRVGGHWRRKREGN